MAMGIESSLKLDSIDARNAQKSYGLEDSWDTFNMNLFSFEKS